MNLVISRLEQTIDRIKDDKLDMHNHKNLQFILGAGDPGYSKHNVIFKSETLNQSQQEAVTRSVNARNFHLIVGPPGTGKTYVITEILEQLLLGNSKILVTAWTNIAVDNILESISMMILIRFKDWILREVSPGTGSSPDWRRKKSSDYWKWRN
jgi:superfamily I DNA and/or RNA helicase